MLTSSCSFGVFHHPTRLERRFPPPHSCVVSFLVEATIARVPNQHALITLRWLFVASLTFASGAGLAVSSAAGHPIHRLHQHPLEWQSSAAGSPLGSGGGGL
jgi:hypothetical protein